jgi:hypothetical protein
MFSIHHMLFALTTVFSAAVFAEDTAFYCPQNHGYIRVGMTEAEVLKLCGTPTVKEKSKSAAVEQVPVTQLIYSTLNPEPVFRGYKLIYNTWSLPVGSGDNNLEVDVIDGKINAIRFNGADTNASNVCNNQSFAVGDLPNKVFSACGSPSITNHTYINRAVKSKSKPITWTYSSDPYQPTFQLIFMDGELKSISH